MNQLQQALDYEKVRVYSITEDTHPHRTGYLRVLRVQNPQTQDIEVEIRTNESLKPGEAPMLTFPIRTTTFMDAGPNLLKVKTSGFPAEADREFNIEFDSNQYCARVKDSLTSTSREGVPESDTVSNDFVLPTCLMANLEDIRADLEIPYPPRRIDLARQLLEDNASYIRQLLEIFDTAEDFDDRSSLELLFHIFKRILELNDPSLLSVMFSDDIFIPMAGVFEYNPGLRKKIDFRTALRDELSHREIVPIEDPDILNRIHFNYRIEAIKDHILARGLNEVTLNVLNIMAQENTHEVLRYTTQNPKYISGILSAIQDKDTRHEGLRLLREICLLVRKTPTVRSARPDPFAGSQAYGSFFLRICESGELFSVLSEELGTLRSSAQIRSMILDILLTISYYQYGSMLREILSFQKHPEAPARADEELVWSKDSSLLTSLLINLKRDQYNRGQVTDILIIMLDVSRCLNDRFLDIFYNNYIGWLLNDFFKDQEPTRTMYEVQASICDILTFCVKSHGYKMRYLIQRQPIFPAVVKYLVSNDKVYTLLAIKFIRQCVATRQRSINESMKSAGIFRALLEVFELNKGLDNVVTSGILELIHWIQGQNIELLVRHIHEKYKPQVQKLSDYAPFALLEKVYLDYDRVLLEETSLRQQEGQALNTLPGRKDIGDEDEAYFSTEDAVDDKLETALNVPPTEDDSATIMLPRMPAKKDDDEPDLRKLSTVKVKARSGLRSKFHKIGWKKNGDNLTSKRKRAEEEQDVAVLKIQRRNAPSSPEESENSEQQRIPKVGEGSDSKSKSVVSVLGRLDIGPAPAISGKNTN